MRLTLLFQEAQPSSVKLPAFESFFFKENVILRIALEDFVLKVKLNRDNRYDQLQFKHFLNNFFRNRHIGFKESDVHSQR